PPTLHSSPTRRSSDLRDGQDPDVDTSGASLTDDELIMFLVLIVVAGNETTRNALTGGLIAFSEFPEQKQQVLEDPSLWDTAVERSEEHTSELQSRENL